MQADHRLHDRPGGRIATAEGTPRHAENFHRDVDDLKFIKLFVYLTDVGDENGTP